MKRCIAWVMVIILVGVMMRLVTFLIVERLGGEWALHSRLKTMAAQNEALSVGSLIPKRLAPDQNILSSLLALTNTLKSTNFESMPPSLRLTSDGRGVVVARLEEWPSGKTTGDWDLVQPAIEQAQDLLSALDAAMEKPGYDSGFDYTKGFIDFKSPSVIPAKQACQKLSYAVVYSLKKGDLATAHRHLCALVNLTAKQTPEPLLICQLVRQACGAMAFNATWQALQSQGWNEGQLASLQNAWSACDFAGDMEAAMVMERALTLDFYQKIRDSRENLDTYVRAKEGIEETLGAGFGELPTHGFVLHWIHLPVWRKTWLAQDELAAFNQMQVVIERARMARTNGFVSLPKSDESTSEPYFLVPVQPSMNFYNRLRFLFSSSPTFLSDNVIKKSLEIQTQQQMTITAIAIERYRLSQGKLPATLASLVPNYLQTLPRDCMDGKPLRYKVDKAGFLLYSVGENGTDEGGDSTRDKALKRYTRIWDGHDAVWPIAATDAEAKQALESKNAD